MAAGPHPSGPAGGRTDDHPHAGTAPSTTSGTTPPDQIRETPMRLLAHLANTWTCFFCGATNTHTTRCTNCGN